MPRTRRPNVANNRTDLLTPAAPGRQMTAPDQEYGKRTAQEQSMKMLSPGPPTVASPAPAGTPPAPSAPASPPAFVGPKPGERDFFAPGTSGQPPTAGLPNTPGPGPEALTGLGAQWHAQQVSEQGSLQGLLHHLASQPQSSSLIKTLAAAAGAS